MENLPSLIKIKLKEKKDFLKLAIRLSIALLVGVYIGNSVIFIGKNKHIVLETKTKDKIVIENRAFYLRVNPFQNYELIDANGSMKTLLTLNDNLTECKTALKDIQSENTSLNKSLSDYQLKCFDKLAVIAANTVDCKKK